ncbi:copper chaperone Copz family protein [Paenibacillus chondroitinus]|uniref:Copper chaperone Copz family protein n=1 Tax=Paenibacillus chondroitinus TaxID=59842 RepID=A0ABU6DGH0_9BACL|nr:MULTISPECIES: copper chaperone Copz family protein [Paenibacillus]MCY9659461.1 copper chaperone Copz family protein [Paenibacillus anseongense]MEB4796856.1 copper chaperone Copz family protein [Paenibacillus chondroitinus]
MDCCAPSSKVEPVKTNCPSCGEKGRSVPLITLKSLLTAYSLETIEPDHTYVFCPNSSCNTVYFSGTHAQTFEEDALKVPVFQKNFSMNVPVCYCFDWTRERLAQAISDNQRPVDHIKSHVQSNRCGCEVNNPQGACCLGNVTAFVGSLK